MTRIENIYELGMNRAVDLPGDVVVIARGTTIKGLKETSSLLSLVECDLDRTPSEAEIERADVIVVEVDPSHEQSIRRIDAIAAMRPGVAIIAGVESVDIHTTRELLKRGVTDLLEIPFSIEQLLGALAEIDPTKLEAGRKQVKLAPVFTFFGCAGGVGTTSLATHFAAALGDAGLRSSMIDLDIQRGDVRDYLGLQNRLSLQDILEAEKRLDFELLSSAIAGREGAPSVLAAPHDILPIEEVKFEQLQSVLDILRHNTDVVTLDLPSALTNWGLSTLYNSNRIILVGEMSVHMIRKLRRQIDFLLSMGIERTSISVVLNNVHSGFFKTIKTTEAEEALNHPIAAIFVDEGEKMSVAQDQGMLVWENGGRGKFEKSIRSFADDLISEVDGEA